MKKNKINIYILSLVMVMVSFANINGQETSYHNNTFENYNQGKTYYNQELYGQAIEELELFLKEIRFLPDSKSNTVYDLKAQTMYHISALRLAPPASRSRIQYCQFHFRSSSQSIFNRCHFRDGGLLLQ